MVNNRNVTIAQGTVLVTRDVDATTGTPIGGHVMPVPWSMRATASGNQALMVTYDPLAVAAALFVNQYSAHITACNATCTSTSCTDTAPDTSVVEEDATSGMRQGKKLYVCRTPTQKQAYKDGMLSMLNGAKEYLFGTTTTTSNTNPGSATAPCPGTTTPAYCMVPTKAHFPYTFWTPNYTTPMQGAGSAFNATTTYAAAVKSAIDAYRAAILAGTGTALEKTMQLAGTATFGSDQALVTSRITRPANYGVACVANDGFSPTFATTLPTVDANGEALDSAFGY